jgi:hypothetical protein
VPPVRTVADVKLRVTPVRTGTTTVLMVMTATAAFSTPLRAAVTVTATAPTDDPAVKVVAELSEGLTLPRLLLLKVHA